MTRAKFVAMSVLVFATITQGGMRIDLRPVGLTVTPGNPPVVYPFQVGVPYNIDVYLVDTGNPTLGNIQFLGLFLDSADTGGDVTAGPTFNWMNPFGIGAVFPNLPNTSWVYPVPVPNPLFQIVLPDNGEVFIGDLNVILTDDYGILDLVNNDNPDANFGARADFGWGSPNDPVTTWRAYTGEITGGRLVFDNTPEPTSLILLSLGALALARKRRL